MNYGKVFVTGGAGFIGRHVIEELVSPLSIHQKQVVNIDKLSYAASREGLPDKNHHLVVGNIGDSDLVSSLLSSHEPAYVVNLAAESHVDKSISDPWSFIDNNVRATARFMTAVLAYWQNLPDGAKEGFRFLHVSTDEVYGPADPRKPFTEEAACNPSSPYAASKAAADHFALSLWKTYGFPVTIVRPANNFGPYQHEEKFIPKVITCAVQGDPIPVYGDGRQIRDWLYVKRTARHIKWLLSQGIPGEVYNLTDYQHNSNIWVVENICELVDRRLDRGKTRSFDLAAYVKDRPGHDRCYSISGAKLSYLRGPLRGHHHESSFLRSLQQTVDWYLENRFGVEPNSKKDRL
jgi:dTDP-glucose 4,6-dehydratase